MVVVCGLGWSIQSNAFRGRVQRSGCGTLVLIPVGAQFVLFWSLVARSSGRLQSYLRNLQKLKNLSRHATSYVTHGSSKDYASETPVSLHGNGSATPVGRM